MSTPSTSRSYDRGDDAMRPVIIEAGFVRTAAGSLAVEGVPIEDLAVQYGTPLFVYSEAALRTAYRRFAGAFADIM